MADNLIGRPTIFSKELADEVCRRIAEGESLRQVCRDESMPCTSTVMKWAREKPEFSQQYAQAREMLLEHWAEDIIEIGDNSSNDWIDRELENGRIDRVPDHELVQRSKLRCDNRKWLLSKLAAKKYGDKIDVTNSDGSFADSLAAARARAKQSTDG